MPQLPSIRYSLNALIAMAAVILSSACATTTPTSRAPSSAGMALPAIGYKSSLILDVQPKDSFRMGAAIVALRKRLEGHWLEAEFHEDNFGEPSLRNVKWDVNSEIAGVTLIGERGIVFRGTIESVHWGNPAQAIVASKQGERISILIGYDHTYFWVKQSSTAQPGRRD